MMRDEFEQFLRSIGLTQELRRGPEGEPFGNWIIQYGNNDLSVSLVHDRGDQSVFVADKHTLRPPGILPPFPLQYDVNLIREMVTGAATERMGYHDQKEFVRAKWNEIAAMFGPDRRVATHERLNMLGRERFKRSIGDWPTPILEFEKFLQDKGLQCQKREAPDGALGDRLMVYTGAGLSVRIDSKGGWRLLFADTVGKPEAWYDVHTLRRATSTSNETLIKFQEWFTFAANYWDAILAMFQPSERERSHQRLAPLEEETRKRRAGATRWQERQPGRA